MQDSDQVSKLLAKQLEGTIWHKLLHLVPPDGRNNINSLTKHLAIICLCVFVMGWSIIAFCLCHMEYCGGEDGNSSGCTFVCAIGVLYLYRRIKPQYFNALTHALCGLWLLWIFLRSYPNRSTI